MKIIPRLLPLLSLVCFVLLLPAAALAGDEWRPVDPADLALKAPIVEKDADAEAIFWEVRIDDSEANQLVFKHYIRVKIFTERGKESQSKIELPYFSSSRITDVAARVIKPDNTIVELKKDDVFDRTIVKTSGVKVKVKSFALPGVEPGAIVEYRWREVYDGGNASRLHLQFQRDIPVQVVSYYLKPYSGMRYQLFHMGEAKFEKDKDYFYKLTKSNMPAFHEEPRMPPVDDVRSWVFLYYTEDINQKPEQYWKDYGKRIFEGTKDVMKVNDDVKNAVTGIIGDATTPEEKLRRIYDYCRTKIKNTSDDASGLSKDEKAKLKENKNPGDTLKNGRGTGVDVDALFAALAKAAGFDARLALSGNRAEMFFDKTLTHSSFLGSAFIAVRVGETWEFFSPAEKYTSFGMLGWREEAQDALITDAKEPFWVRTSLATADKSGEKRRGKFSLSEDGTLEGDVRLEYSGHRDFEQKESNDDDSPTQREETLRNFLKERMSTAEVSDIHIENVADPLKPFTYSYHVRVPGYAQRTGKRLFLQPGYFEHGQPAVFPAGDRKHAIYFHYPWSEQDEVEISLPAGYALDHADAPGEIKPEMTQGVSAQSVKLSVTMDGRKLILRRNFFFGGEDLIFFPATSYGPLRQLFETIYQNDNHTITLKQTATTATN